MWSDFSREDELKDVYITVTSVDISTSIEGRAIKNKHIILTADR